MDNSAFYRELAGILALPVESIGPELLLSSCNWDSLAVVSTILAIDEVFNVAVEAEALARCATVGDIEALVASLPSA